MKYQTVWVIERKPFAAEDESEYRTIYNGLVAWTYNVWDALWFGKEVDAREFAKYLNGDKYTDIYVIVEHRMYHAD